MNPSPRRRTATEHLPAVGRAASLSQRADGAPRTPFRILEMAGVYLRGLIQQIYSLPLEIRVARICFETCPGLREMREERLNAHLRKLSEVFSPKVRQQVPPDVFDRNVAMNAALAKAWGELTDSKLPIIPYEATGYLGKGSKRLLRGTPHEAGRHRGRGDR